MPARTTACPEAPGRGVKELPASGAIEAQQQRRARRYRVDMEIDPLDRDIDGLPHFYNVPTPWLPHLGRLAVLSARIERIARDLAAELDLPVPPNARTHPLAQQCRAIVKRLRDPWLPEWIDAKLPGWSKAAMDWAETTPDRVDETRNLYLHAEYVHMTIGDDFVPVMVDYRSGEDHVRVDDEMLRAAIERLVPVDRYGFRIYWMLYQHRHPLPPREGPDWLVVGGDGVPIVGE